MSHFALILCRIYISNLSRDSDDSYLLYKGHSPVTIYVVLLYKLAEPYYISRHSGPSLVMIVLSELAMSVSAGTITPAITTVPGHNQIV